MKPRLIYFNRPPKREAWGGGAHFITSFYEHLTSRGHRITFDLNQRPDLVFIFDPRADNSFAGIEEITRYKSDTQCKVVARINDTDGARPNDPPWRDKAFIRVAETSDHVVFISDWVKQYHLKNGLFCSSSTVIHNGCNQKFFHKKTKSNIQSPVKIVTHHWSTNAMKGFQLYQDISHRIDPGKFELTYVGRWNPDFDSSKLKLLPPLYGHELGDELRKHDIYITASKNEACGMHHIEAASCGLPVLYHMDGGGICEVAAKNGESFHDVDSLIDKLRLVSENYERYFCSIDNESLSNERCFSSYENVIISL